MFVYFYFCRPPSPIQGISPRNTRIPEFADNGLDLSLTGSGKLQIVRHITLKSLSLIT